MTSLAKAAREIETAAKLRSCGNAEPALPRRPNVIAGANHRAAGVKRAPAEPAAQKANGFNFQPRTPVVVGEATYRGYLPIDGVISGQLTSGGGGLTIKQRVRPESRPELDGELWFKDMLRVNGHISGKVTSERGTLIIDDAAIVDAQVDVGIAIISGVVNGDVVARERVELGQGAVINGNISTPLLSIKPGATFHGDCRMLKTGS